MKTGPILSRQTCKRWIKALRSGEFTQGREHLKHGNQHGTKHCCLGVLHDISDYPVLRASQQVSPGPALSQNRISTLIKYNDGGKSFDMIADHIERHTLPHCPEKKVDKKRVF